MLSERDLHRLAQIEAHLRADAPDLARLLSKGGRWALLRRPEPDTARGLAAAALTTMVGAVILFLGLFTGNAPLLAIGLVGVIVMPLPAWLASTSRRFVRLRTG
jgi:hypothetical protein